MGANHYIDPNQLPKNRPQTVYPPPTYVPPPPDEPQSLRPASPTHSSLCSMACDNAVVSSLPKLHDEDQVTVIIIIRMSVQKCIKPTQIQQLLESI